MMKHDLTLDLIPAAAMLTTIWLGAWIVACRGHRDYTSRNEGKLKPA